MKISSVSEIGIGLPIRFGIPFHEGCKWVIGRGCSHPGHNDFTILDPVGDHVAWLKAEGGAHRLGDGGLELGSQSAGR